MADGKIQRYEKTSEGGQYFPEIGLALGTPDNGLEFYISDDKRSVGIRANEEYASAVNFVNSLLNGKDIMFRKDVHFIKMSGRLVSTPPEALEALCSVLSAGTAAESNVHLFPATIRATGAEVYVFSLDAPEGYEATETIYLIGIEVEPSI